MALLDVSGLSIAISGIELLNNLSFSVDKGEVLGIVGESGSGKSMTALTIMGLLPLIGGQITQGSIRFDGQDLVQLPEADIRALRGKRIAFITQNPMTALDPVIRIGRQIDEVSMLHLGLDKAAAKARSLELMDQLRIPKSALVHEQYPHQLSGGMKQRIVIAMALAGDPDLIIADEPSTALDVTVQAQIIQLLSGLVAARGLALILITHDMSVVAQACDRVVVLYAGRMAESQSVVPLFAAPAHPYTQALIGCIPNDHMHRGDLTGIPGIVPGAARYPSGCRFHPRCGRAQEICVSAVPPVSAFAADGLVACHFPGPTEAGR